MFSFIPQGPAVSRWACAYFFAICGMTYGTVMSRVPAIKLQSGLNEAELGYALLCLGLGGLTAFPLSGFIQSRTGSRTLQIISGSAMVISFPLIGLPTTLLPLCAFFYLCGLAMGASDIAMGTQSILVERALQRPCMSSLHAMYSVGGLLGSLGSFWLSRLPLVQHFALVAVLLLCFLPIAASRLLEDNPEPSKQREAFRMPPPILFLLGFLILCSYASEGSVGDWGALFLHEVKHMDQSSAALAYAAFCTTMVSVRLVGDRLRARFGDRLLMRVMACLASCGMFVVLYAPWPVLCLGGYALMGLGMSVIVPIIFSAVGRMPHISPGVGVTILSIFGYGSLLLAPPLIGIMAHATSLQTALSLILVLCLGLVAGSGMLKRIR